tara:strand:- start:7828 stop:9309 length:1482 start_codon:yes stop_codon:yes gene_type:complete
MSLLITQEPRYLIMPVGQPTVFTASYNNIVANKFNVKFIAYVRIAPHLTNLQWSTYNVATLKVTPNNTGQGIFDMRSVLENYVKPDYEGGAVYDGSSDFSTSKGVDYSETTPHPIHLIDSYSTARNNAKWLQVWFNIEYGDTATDPVSLHQNSPIIGSSIFLMYNGVIQETDILDIATGDAGIGFNLNRRGFVLNTDTDKALTNAPATQYIRFNDYATIPFIANTDNLTWTTGDSGATVAAVRQARVQLYDSGGSNLANFNIQDSTSRGGSFQISSRASTRIHYFGCGPANFDGAVTGSDSAYNNWNTHKANVSYYTVKFRDDDNNDISQTYTFNIQDDDCKGFETIRLTWLNRHGTWDYYNFTKKSIRSLKTKKIRYQQLKGVWNQEKYYTHGYRGGQKVYSNDTIENITINTDFLTEEEGIWIEELMTSPDVFILKQERTVFSADEGVVHKYIEPVIVTNSNHTRMTKANDKLIQYTIELERSKTVNSQRA